MKIYGKIMARMMVKTKKLTYINSVKPEIKRLLTQLNAKSLKFKRLSTHEMLKALLLLVRPG